MFKKIFLLTAAALFVLSASRISFAQEFSLALAKEKVEAAAKLIEAEGEAAFPKLRDPNGEFRFAGGKGYIWIHSMSGPMLMHPTKPELEGTNALELKDSTGFAFIVAMNVLVRKYGAGWVVYLWPLPGKKTEEYKGSFVKLARYGGKEYVVGCGIYYVSKDYIKSQLPQDLVYDSTSQLN
jgi:signal transduction histidine kinase